MKPRPYRMIRPGKPRTAHFCGSFSLKNRSMGKKQGPMRTAVGPHGSKNHDQIMIMISLSVMRSGVHAKPMGFFEEELGFGRREKRVVGIRRVLGLGRGIRVLDKPHLYSHKERERERKDRLVLLSSC